MTSLVETLTDLQNPISSPRSLYLRIDGLEPFFWQSDGAGKTNTYKTVLDDCFSDSSLPKNGINISDGSGSVTEGEDLRLFIPNGENAQWTGSTAVLGPSFYIPTVNKNRAGKVRYYVSAKSLTGTTSYSLFYVALTNSVESVGSGSYRARFTLTTSDEIKLDIYDYVGASATLKHEATFDRTNKGWLGVMFEVDMVDSSYSVYCRSPGAYGGSEYALYYTDNSMNLSYCNFFVVAASNWGGLYSETELKVSRFFVQSCEAITGEIANLAVDKVCLIPPQEVSTSIDLSSMESSLSAMTFELLDIPDDDGTSYFGKLFAPARWETEYHEQIATTDTPNTMLAADATSITLRSGSTVFDSVSTGGIIYLGQETISHTGCTDGVITGVTRGLYSCIGDRYTDDNNAITSVKIPLSGSNEPIPVVSTRPFSFVGRMVALYCVTDRAVNNEYTIEESSVLLWCGRISDRIRYDLSRCVWQLSCESILEDLKRKILVNPPRHNVGLLAEESDPYKTSVNLLGRLGRSFVVSLKFNTRHVGAGNNKDYQTVTSALMSVKKNIYTGFPSGIMPTTPSQWDSYCEYSSDVIWTSGVWKDATGAEWDEEDRPYANIRLGINSNGELTAWVASYGGISDIEAYHNISDGWMEWISIQMELLPCPEPCAFLTALGAPGGFIVEFTEDDMSSNTTIAIPSAKPFQVFHPCPISMNGGKLFLGKASAQGTEDFSTELILDQGDEDTVCAWLKIDGVKFSSDENKKSYYFARIAEAYDTPGYGFLYLIEGNVGEERSYSPKDSYIGWRRNSSDAIPYAQTIYKMNFFHAEMDIYNKIFEPFLYPMLSTGMACNTYYDKLPSDFGIGILSYLVNFDSFYEADDRIKSSNIRTREVALVTETTSIYELLQKECALYGYSIVWKNGKINIVPITNPSVSSWSVELSDSNILSGGISNYESSTETVINQYEVKYNYSYQEKKFMSSVIVTDVDSVMGLSVTKSSKIEHKFLRLIAGDEVYTANSIRKQLTGRFLRYPNVTISVALPPTLANRIFVGDVVLVTSSVIPDPYGSGTKTVSMPAIVLRVSWNYTTWAGSATLMLYTNTQSVIARIAPSALVNKSWGTGGWNSSTYQFKLNPYMYYRGDATSGYIEDGSCFASGDAITVIERCPKNVSNPQKWTGLTIAKDYEEDGENLLTLDSTTLTGYNSSVEYVIVCENYGTVVATQEAKYAYLCNWLTLRFADGQKPYKWE